MSLLAPFTLIYFFSYNKIAAIKSTLLLAALLGCFVGFSIHEFGQILPDYYLPQRLSGGKFLTAIYGNSFSPSRGLFIFSPFLLISWLCFWASSKEWNLNKSWLLIGLAWPLTHLVIISNFPDWSAGFAFGPRYLTDILPGLFLLTIYTWPVLFVGAWNKISIAILAVSVVFAVFVNSYQGLFNQATKEWSWVVGASKYQELFFDWEHPQFLANEKDMEDFIHSDRYISLVRSTFDMIENNTGEVENHFSSKCFGNIDDGGVSSASENVFGSILLNTLGWLTKNIDQAIPLDSVLVVLRDVNGKLIFIKTHRKYRADVGTYYKNPSLASSGFESTADVSLIPGDYMLGLAYKDAGQVMICPEFNIPISIK